MTFEAQSTLCELLAACVHGKSADDFVVTREDGKPVRDFRDTWAKVCEAADSLVCCSTIYDVLLRAISGVRA